MIASFFILVVLLHYSTVISELSERNVTLAQRLAILEERLKRAESRASSCDYGNEEAEVAAIIDRLRAELEVSPPGSAGQGEDEPLGPLTSRRSAERLRGVTAERPYLAREGAWGRMRGLLLDAAEGCSFAG